jgi:hypothetical protein
VSAAAGFDFTGSTAPIQPNPRPATNPRQGARDIIALGDCCRLWGDPLPPTAQVAGQQVRAVAAAHHLSTLLHAHACRTHSYPHPTLDPCLQGAYTARLINRGYQVNEGGLNVPPPIRVSGR